MSASQHDAIVELQRANAELRQQRDAAAAQTAALGEVLRAIAASPDDPQPVFELIARHARELCGAAAASIAEYDGALLQAPVMIGFDQAEIEGARRDFPRPPGPDSFAGRTVLTNQIVHSRHIDSDPLRRSTGLGGRFQSALYVPLRRDGQAIGCIGLRRVEQGGFDDAHVALVESFAEQASLAIAGAATLRELRARTGDLQESLEYQTATSDVLKVISRSTFDLRPVLDTVIQTASRLCDSEQAMIFHREGEFARLGANFGFPPEYEAFLRGRGTFPLDDYPTTVGTRSIREGRPVHVDDVATIPGYPESSTRLGKQRTTLGVPLLRAGEAIGTLLIARQRVEPFTERQIELVSTFADQAVIAIENTRLITEQKEALEQQTATAEVLGVINASPGDLAPVFEAILDKAHALCGATIGSLFTYDGELQRAVATHGLPEELAVLIRRGVPINDTARRMTAGGTRPGQIPDIRAIQGLVSEVGRFLLERTDVRTILFVPLRKDADFLGYISAMRPQVRPFSDKEIALLENFAAQAVIAMENARLLGELRERTAELAERNTAFAERIDHQAATIDVLKEMSASPGDAQPVFDLIVRQAKALLGTPVVGLFEYDGELVHYRANTGSGAVVSANALASYRSGWPRVPDRGSLTCRAILDGALIHIRDLDAEAGISQAVRDLGHKTQVSVPLLRDGRAIGAITTSSMRVDGVTGTQIELLKTFAEQAVIAITSAETYRALQTRTADLQESLEQQTATAEVLGVINASPGDLTPVFDAILEKAMRLCSATIGGFYQYNGQWFDTVALRGVTTGFAEFSAANPLSAALGGPPSLILETKRPVQVEDIAATERYRDGSSSYRRAMVDVGGIRAVLDVPLLKDGAVLGFIAIYRAEPGAFPEKQIALLESFAAQAVIAMENARLLTEQREALERQTATAEVLQVINANPGDVAPVFDSILESAHRVCGAAIGSLWLYDGEMIHAAATRGMTEEAAVLLRQLRRPSTAQEKVIRERARFFHSADFQTDDVEVNPEIDATGVRTILGVPLVKDDKVVGIISARRREARLFSDREIELLENFAAQAVIAMENARLLTETREALEQQTATAEVLEVINESPGDLAPVFDAILNKAHTLCGAAIGSLYTWDGESVWAVATHGFPEAYAAFARQKNPPNFMTRPLIEGERYYHVLDVRALEPTQDMHASTFMEQTDARTILLLPLRKDGAFAGFISVVRTEVRPFVEKEIALLENFAAQAVIAMENARLLTETQEALEQQTATAEVLQVINASPGDLTPVFDAMLEKAMRLCGAAFGLLRNFDGESVRTMATRGLPDSLAEFSGQTPLTPPPDSTMGRALKSGRSAEDLDLRETDLYKTGVPGPRAMVDLGGARTVLQVPLVKDRVSVGLFTFYRQEVRSFSDKQIALLENFAAQAVIAMENARLLTETQEALEQQTATAEVLQVINASPGDLAPVFDAMLEKAMRLCGAAFGVLRRFDGERIQALATRGVPAAYAEYSARNETIPMPGTGPARALETGHAVQTLDVRDGVGYTSGEPGARAVADLGGARTIIHVPLVKDRAAIGFFSFYRQEVRAFSDKQIALLENFAAQAVIAMESARLLNELRTRTDELAQRQAELRVTFENMGDGVAMFDETQHLAAWNRKFQDILDVPNEIIARRQTFTEYVRYLAERGEYGPGVDADEHVRMLIEQAGQARSYERTRPDGRVIEIRHNPVASGGFVLIYADITERKRNEAEIAAARDAAQEAARTIEAAFRDLKTAQANLIQAEKMASLGQLTAGIAHEIKNPLNFVNNFASLSVDLLAELKEAAAPGFATLSDDQRAEIDDVSALLTSNLQKITEHGKRADGIVRAMLEHSRGASGERRTVDINALVDEALNLAYHGARAQDQSFNIALERDFAGGIAPIELNPQDITRVFLNLFSNGFYAATKRARDNAPPGFQPTLSVVTRDLGDRVEIRVRDNGTGISDDIREKLFEPFFTTKPTGEGTGLGLSITYDIVTKQHGGTIAVESEVGDHTEFSISLPRRMFAAEGAVA